MAITKETEIAKIEIVGGWNVQIASDTVIKEDDVEIGRSRVRNVLQPFQSTYTTDSEGKKTCSPIYLIINQLQNGFIYYQPPIVLIINQLCFTFSFYFIKYIDILLQSKYDVYWII